MEEAQDRDWREYFDDSPSGGYACLICFALVPALAEYAQQHLAWHERGGPHRAL